MSQPRSSIAVLELQRRGETVATYEVSPPRATIGRSASNAIRLVDFRVSRLHAEIEWRPDGSIVLIDLDSHGGTWLDDRRLRSRQAAPLEEGSRIIIVDHVFIFRRKNKDVDIGDDRFLVLHTEKLLGERLAAERNPSTSAFVSSDEVPGSFRQLLKASWVLDQGENLEQVLDATSTDIIRRLPLAERVCFLLEHLPGPGFRYSQFSRRRDSAAYRTMMSARFLRQAFDECQAILVAPAPTERPPDDEGNPKRCRISAWACVPLTGLKARSIGVLIVSSKPFEPPFSEVQLRQAAAGKDGAIKPLDSLPFTTEDLQWLCRYALPLGWALEFQEAGRQDSDRTCREIGAGLPRELQPELPGYSLERMHVGRGQFRPRVCEFITLGTDTGENGSSSSNLAERGVVVVIDVKENGIRGALTMADVYLEIRALLLQGLELPVVLTRVNRLLHAVQSEGPPVSVLLARIDAGTHQLTVLNAGHAPFFVVRGHGTIETPKQDRPASTPLGTSPDPVFGLCITHLEPGDWSVLSGSGNMDLNELQLLAGRRSFGVDPIPTQPGSSVLGDLRRWAFGDRQPRADDCLFYLGRDCAVPDTAIVPDDPNQS
jgi:hypothetical protein